MAVTVNQQPSSYQPVYSPLIFEATSTQIAQPNFTYTVKCTDLITSAVATYEVEQAPVTGELVFDASNFAKQYVKNYIPNNVYGFQKCTDAIRKIRVNIGETYGTTPTYYAGSNIDFIVWNGCVEALSYPSYTSTDYVYKNSTNNYKYLTSDTYNTLNGWYTSNKVTYSGKSHFLYCLSSENNDLEFIRINAYDSSGNLLHYSDIANPYQTGTTYTDKLVCIDVGHKGLSNISAGLVTGTYPIITASVAYYDVIDAYTNIVPTARQNVSRIYIGCEAKYDIYTLHYLDKKGNFETLHFPKKSEVNMSAEKTYYKQNPYTLSSNVWSYSTFAANERVLNSSSQKFYKLNTDWLTKELAGMYAHIINSPVVYVDLGTSGLVPVIVSTNNLIIPNIGNREMKSIQVDMRYTFKDTWQNG